jgi:hypothetical protein
LFRKNYAPKIAKATTFDKTERRAGAGLRYIHIQKRSRSGIGTAATDLASVAGASPRNFRLAGSTV